ncbi:hypothetical protein SASPL_101075 [Salvia splendens]|uniref:(-)-germacrene D synthase n=1 Tax=Salvia splendens TaxID=180675 RepID=A0A8X8YU55_SALSN|nr:hypothetical protein SASPL_101075 [Salvia splendens]
MLEKQKVEVKKLLAQTPDDSTLKMDLINAIQRLGVAYHFSKEIDDSLRKIHHNYESQSSKDKNNVGVLALRFRLLRQHGYRVSCDVFNGLVDKEGNLKESLIDDVEGMLSLYEASNCGINGEDILDKALEFSSSHLRNSLHKTMSTSLSNRVKEALEMPISKSLIRLGAKKFISMYQLDESHNQTLLNFAKLDFNIVQKIHQRELHHITRWDISAAEELPPYMRICYEALLGVYSEMEDEMAKRGQSYRLQYARKEMIKLAGVYMEEAEWCYSKHVPTMDEYMKLALVSGAYMMLSTTSLVGMGDPITQDDFDWITTEPPIVRAASVICRLMDDMVGHGIEAKTTSVDCYMKENGCSKMEAFDEFWKRVKKAWKDINEECLEPRAASMAILVRIVHLARVINLLYVGEDSYGNPKTKTKEMVKMVLVEPVQF